jgi:hypothetical protein
MIGHPKTKKHVKNISLSLAIKEMQINTTLRFPLTPARISPSRIPTTNVGQNTRKRNPHTLLMGM